MKSLLLAALASALAFSGARAEPRPNLVFLLTDDQCSDSLGCYGNADVQTPQIDRLAAEGVAFDCHYDTTAICMASRASIVTGMFEYKTGCNFDHGALLAEHWAKSYPILLREAGYRTAMAGKIGFEIAAKPKGKGALPEGDFDKWGAGPGQTEYETAKNPSMVKYAAEFPHSTRAYGAFGRDFIAESAAAGKPFCLSISFKAPHHPVQPDPVFDDVYAGKAFAKPKNFGRENGAHFSKQSRQGRQYERFISWGYASDYEAVMAKYHQQIYAVDVAVGMIREALEKHGVAGNTVIVFTSDNGFLCGAHGYGSKVLPYEEASRVPLIIYDPRLPKAAGLPRRCDQLTGNVDLAPTLLDLAGIAPPPNMDGKSLRPLLEENGSAVHRWLPLINVWGPAKVHSLAVVTREKKFIYWPYGGDGFTPTEELYDLAEDRLELKNLAAVGGSGLGEMRALYDEAVAHWKREAVPYHGYQVFGKIFDRALPWAEKVR
ncbi:MAG: sulfatase [Verrucomicrobiales bacterium]